MCSANCLEHCVESQPEAASKIRNDTVINLHDDAAIVEQRQAEVRNSDATNSRIGILRNADPLQLARNGLALLQARWYLRSAASLGPRVRVWGRLIVSNKGTLIVGDRTRLSGTIVPLQIATGANGTLEIGERVSINYGCSIGATQLVKIGSRTRFGPYVMVMDNSFHHLEPERRHIRPSSKPVAIGEDVWLGARVVVLPGVTIGAGSVVGAGSIVTHDIPPRTFAAGAPARAIRQF